MHEGLERTLRELHTQLEDVSDLEQHEVDMLKQSLVEIQSTLEHTDVSSATLAKRFHETADQFSESHPVITQTIGRLADMLAQMGI